MLVVLLALVAIAGGILLVRRWFKEKAPSGPVVTGYVDADGNPVDMPFEFAAVLERDKDGNITAPACLNIKPVLGKKKGEE